MACRIEIDDASDARLACYANLRFRAKPASDADSFIVEGRWCLQRLIECRHAILSVLVDRGSADEVASWLPAETPLYSLPLDQIRQLVGFDFHRGVLACGRRPILQTIDELEFRPGMPALTLGVLGVSESENLGSIMRTAAALGIDNILIGPKTADPFSRRAVRVSMATALKLNLYRLDQPVAQLDDLRRRRNIRTIVTTLDPDATPLKGFVADDRESIVIVGNEADGVDRAVQRVATDRITIPMELGTDSLNVSIAAAIFMYDLLNRFRHRSS